MHLKAQKQSVHIQVQNTSSICLHSQSFNRVVSVVSNWWYRIESVGEELQTYNHRISRESIIVTAISKCKQGDLSVSLMTVTIDMNNQEV